MTLVHVHVYICESCSCVFVKISNPAVGELLLQFVRAGDKPMGFICHGPLVALSMALVTQPWPFIGRNMTVLCHDEEVIKTSCVLPFSDACLLMIFFSLLL